MAQNVNIKRNFFLLFELTFESFIGNQFIHDISVDVTSIKNTIKMAHNVN